MGGRPNILWIVTTQWRAQALGHAGDANARTPHLDALAAESVAYTQAVTPHPFGPFARAALLTGVPSPENGVVDYHDALPPGTRTIAHGLRELGYETGFFGKWHLWRRDPATPLVGEEQARIVVPPEARGGFDFWEGFEGGFLLNNPWLHGTRLEKPVRVEGYQSEVIVDRTQAWVKERAAGGRPWFAITSLEAPHPPYDAPAGGVAPLEPGAVALAANVPRGGEVEAKARRELAGYYAHIEATDRAVGRLVRSLADGGTVVLFTSVHGDMHGSHGLFRKGWPQEESVRVPLLVRLPGRPGRRDAGAVSLLDVPAMTLAWARGGEWRMERAHSRISMPSVVRLPHQCDRVWRGVRSATRKFVLGPEGDPWLFFDLEKDPGETNNLAGSPAHAAEMAEWRKLV